MSRRGDPEQERRKLFRRMEWVFVYGPPALAVFMAVFGGLFLAFAVEIDGTNLLGRWALAVLVILVLPVVAYLVKERLGK